MREGDKDPGREEVNECVHEWLRKGGGGVGVNN